jgi:hypothetical protein
MNRKRDLRALIVVFVVVLAGMLPGLIRPANADVPGSGPSEVIALHD